MTRPRLGRTSCRHWPSGVMRPYVRDSQRQPEALAVVLRAQIARLNQLHGLIAVLCRHRWCRAGEDGIHKTCILLTIAPLVRDCELKEVVLHDGLPQP